MYSPRFSKSFLRVLKFLQIKKGRPNFWGEPTLQNVWIIWSHLVYLDFKSFLYLNSLLFIRFQCILYDSGVLLSEFSNLYKLKRGDLTSGGNQFCRMSELFGLPFGISILKVLWTQILRHSFFSESSNFCKLKRGDLISRGNEFCRMSELFGPPSVFQF